MPIGIISALQEEIELLLETMELRKERLSGKRTYYEGVFEGHDIVVAFSRWGKVASAITATDLVNEYDISEILFFGVAGALDSRIQIGDIVIGDRLVQHDLDASPIFKEFEIPLTGKRCLETHEEMRLNLHQASKDFVDDVRAIVSPSLMDEMGIDRPQIFQGLIASGDQFISNPQVRNKILAKLPDIYCVEMEGAAVGQVCNDFDIPYGLVRIISDSANESAPDDFLKFIKEIASVYSLEILRRYLRKS